MNDQLIALIRQAWQATIAAAITYLLRLGIDIDSDALFAVTWPIVMFVYYFVAQQVIKRTRSSKLSVALTGPGKLPVYNDIPDEVLEAFLVEQTAVQ